jgi:hypothetical protein
VILDQTSLTKSFLSAPGDDLVDKLIGQLQKIPQMVQLFGPAEGGSWANYNRFDWSARQLPAINILEAQSESKSSDHGYLTGTVQIQVYWPSEFRRADLARVPNLFKGILENFFSSKYVSAMLDELYCKVRPEKVFGLNEFGKTLTWSPNVEGITDGDLTPMTILDVQYRIDLRAWERALEYLGRTEDDPFTATLPDLSDLVGRLDGVDDNDGKNVIVTVPLEVTLNED